MSAVCLRSIATIRACNAERIIKFKRVTGVIRSTRCQLKINWTKPRSIDVGVSACPATRIMLCSGRATICLSALLFL